MGRRVAHYTKRIADDLCLYIATGHSLENALKKIGYLAPTMTQVWRWLDEHEEFREQYNRARQMQADVFADKTLDMVDAVLQDPKSAAAYRLAVDIYNYHSSIRNPKVYNKNAVSNIPPVLDANKIRAEIKRLEKELGVANEKAKPDLSVVPIKKAE